MNIHYTKAYMGRTCEEWYLHKKQEDYCLFKRNFSLWVFQKTVRQINIWFFLINLKCETEISMPEDKENTNNMHI